MRRFAVPAVLAAGTVAVRLPAVWTRPLSQDEVFSARILDESSLPRALHRIVRTESTPPLWYLLGWLVRRLEVPVADVRLLSVAFSAGMTLLVYALARRVFGAAAAAVAGALVAVAYEPVVHGSELRAYSLLVLLTTLAALALLREVEHPSRWNELTLAGAVWAGLLTHYYFGFSLVAMLLWLWTEPKARALRRRATAAIAVGGALAAPWLPGFLAQYRHDHFWWIGRFSARVVATTPLALLVPYGPRHLALGAAALVVVAVGLAVLWRRSAPGRLLALMAVTPIAIAAAAWSGGVRTYDVRNLVETAPFVAVAVVAAAAAVPRLVAAPAGIALVAVVAVVSLTQVSLPSPPYALLAHDLVAEGWRPADPIAVYGNFFTYRAPLEWYLPNSPLLDVSRPARSCSALFVIERHAHRFTVERLDRVSPLLLRRATLLATAHAPLACVRLSRDPRLRPLA